jgi:hypothetical protein
VLYANSEDLDTLSGQVGTLSSKAALLEYFFHTTSELLYTAAQAGLALPYPSPIQQLHLDTLKILVRGASAWDGNLSKLTIQDTSSSPVPLVDIDVAALLGNAILLPGSAGVTLHPAFVMGATPGKSLHIIADDTVTAGSPLEIMIAGRNWQPV